MLNRIGLVAGVMVVALSFGCTTCEGLRQEARDAGEAAATCVTGDTCVVFTYHSCLGVFSCGVAVRADAEQELRDKVRDLAEDHAGQCDECSQPFCQTVTGAECVAGRCVAQ